jgi:hypothetical protein
MNFQRGIPPVEPVMGVFCESGRSNGQLSVFAMWQVSVQVNVQNVVRSIRLPRFRIRACFERFGVSIFSTLKGMNRLPKRDGCMDSHALSGIIVTSPLILSAISMLARF